MKMTEPGDENTYSEDAISVLVHRNLQISSGLKTSSHDSSRQTALLPCAHEMPSDYLISLCKYNLKKISTLQINIEDIRTLKELVWNYVVNQKTVQSCHQIYFKESKNVAEFTCPRFDEGRKNICGIKFSYQDLCHSAPLTPELKEWFEEKLGALAAAKFCDYKACPGCKYYVERANQKNLCVHCTMCSAQKKCSYQFCWKCLREWKGPALSAVRCGYSDCGKQQTSQKNNSLLKVCQPEFKTQKVQTEQTYPTMNKSSDRKRLALIINNIEFRDLKLHRRGADMDEQNMKTLLEGLGYNVIILNNLTAEGMDAAIRDFAQRNEHRFSDSTFVVIMSHGGSDGIHGINFDDNENDIFSEDKIFHYLNTENCHSLIDKPKIIFIQTCRGEKDSGVWVPDAGGHKKIHLLTREKDFGCLRSCTPEAVSFRNSVSGSVFIQNLVEIFNDHSHENDIMELFRKIFYWFQENYPQQMPCLERTTLVKKFYLFPGL